VAAVWGEEGAEAVADEGFAAVDGLDMAIVVAVAGDDALEVGGFVEEGSTSRAIRLRTLLGK
jgi:hypothetical protein